MEKATKVILKVIELYKEEPANNYKAVCGNAYGFLPLYYKIPRNTKRDFPWT